MTNTKTKIFKLGTRQSPMAISVAQFAKKQIEKQQSHFKIDINTFVSEGDRITGDLKMFGGKGTFIKDLETRLLSKEIDCAIHALKDIPGDIPMHEDLCIIAFFEREDPRDAMILREGISENYLHEKEGCIIGTSAPRRQAQLKKLFPKAQCKLTRGNVNTRLKKLDNGDYDCLVLSAAGLVRIGFKDRINKFFSLKEMIPAVGQGILCLQIRKADISRLSFLKTVNNAWSENAAKAERAILHSLNGNCHSAIAAHCEQINNSTIQLSSAVFNCNTGDLVQSIIKEEFSPCDFYEMGIKSANELKIAGAVELL